MGVRRGGVTRREYKACREYEVMDVGGNARVLSVWWGLEILVHEALRLPVPVYKVEMLVYKALSY